MRGLLRQSLAEGAWGLSSGLDYPPGVFAELDELVALGKELAAAEAGYHTHIRSGAATLDEALAEMLAVGAAGVRLHVSHLNSSAAVWHAVPLVARSPRRSAFAGPERLRRRLSVYGRGDLPQPAPPIMGMRRGNGAC